MELQEILERLKKVESKVDDLFADVDSAPSTSGAYDTLSDVYGYIESAQGELQYALDQVSTAQGDLENLPDVYGQVEELMNEVAELRIELEKALLQRTTPALPAGKPTNNINSPEPEQISTPTNDAFAALTKRG